MKKIDINSNVIVNYTGKLEDGTIFDTSLIEGREPLKVKLGENQLIKGFENGLIDMSVGDTKIIEIEPTDAYGDINENLIVDVERKNVPENIEIGTMLQTFGPMGVNIVKVVGITEDKVTIDANHPLAGRKLIFELEVLEVN